MNGLIRLLDIPPRIELTAVVLRLKPSGKYLNDS